jgi:hypothetical protein
MLTGPANPSRSRADLPCSSSMEKFCARYSTSRQLRTARHSWRCVSAFAHDSAICHNGHRWKARSVRGACTRLESTGRDPRSHLAELVPLAHVEHPRGKCSAADGPQASERLRKNADAYRHFCPARYLSAEFLHFAIVLSITRRLCSSKATVKMPPCLARRTCLIRLAVAHSFVLCGETSTRQCCHTEVSVLPEVKRRGACEGCVSYREERVCSQHGSVTVLEHDRVPLRDRSSSSANWNRRGKQGAIGCLAWHSKL